MSLTSEVQGALGRRTWAGGLEGVYANECWSRRSSRRPGAILTAAPPVTEVERQRLVTHMQMTASWFEDEVSGPVAGASGVSPVRDLVDDLEVLDHLVVVGPIYWKDPQRAKQRHIMQIREIKAHPKYPKG